MPALSYILQIQKQHFNAFEMWEVDGRFTIAAQNCKSTCVCMDVYARVCVRVCVRTRIICSGLTACQ